MQGGRGAFSARRSGELQPGFIWQQPVMQENPAGHGGCPGRPQGCLPAGQSCWPQPGGSGWPMQISHMPQGFKQAGTWVHGLHLVGSLTVLMLQLPVPGGFSEPSQTVVGAPGMAQQPKQSHPFGVSGPQ